MDLSVRKGTEMTKDIKDYTLVLRMADGSMAGRDIVDTEFEALHRWALVLQEWREQTLEHGRLSLMDTYGNTIAQHSF